VEWDLPDSIFSVTMNNEIEQKSGRFYQVVPADFVEALWTAWWLSTEGFCI
jgi:hypothetical protein